MPLSFVLALLYALSPGPPVDINYCESPPPELQEACLAQERPEPPRHRRDY